MKSMNLTLYKSSNTTGPITAHAPPPPYPPPPSPPFSPLLTSLSNLPAIFFSSPSPPSLYRVTFKIFLAVTSLTSLPSTR